MTLSIISGSDDSVTHKYVLRHPGIVCGTGAKGFIV